jgi:hypothetical protein
MPGVPLQNTAKTSITRYHHILHENLKQQNEQLCQAHSLQNFACPGSSGANYLLLIIQSKACFFLSGLLPMTTPNRSARVTSGEPKASTALVPTKGKSEQQACTQRSPTKCSKSQQKSEYNLKD